MRSVTAKTKPENVQAALYEKGDIYDAHRLITWVSQRTGRLEYAWIADADSNLPAGTVVLQFNDNTGLVVREGEWLVLDEDGGFSTEPAENFGDLYEGVVEKDENQLSLFESVSFTN